MTGVKGKSVLNMTENLLSHNDFYLLLRAVYLLNTSCRVLDRHLFAMVIPEKHIGSRFAYRFTQPIGVGWEFIISYIVDNKEKIMWVEKSIQSVVEMLTTWTKSQKYGNITRLAGEAALFLYDKWINDEYIFSERDFVKKIFSIIAFASHEIKDELIQIIKSVIDNTHINRRTMHIDLCEYLIKDIYNASVVCEAIPESIITLCNKLWRKTELEKDEDYFLFQMDENDEEAYGLATSCLEYYLSSAFQTPVFSLLKNAPQATINFIIDFFNYTTDHFNKSYINRQYHESKWIVINFEEGLTIQQLCSDRFWGLYRGISAGPELLSSILMALEKWLLGYIEQSSEEHANELCKYLLKESNNVCITSVITSLVIAYPEKLFSTALWLIHIQDIFSLDKQRFNHEDQINLFMGMPNNKLYDNERLETNKLAFRKNTFSQVIIDYQIKRFGKSENDWYSKKTQLYECIDELTEQVLTDNTSVRLMLNRIDLRKYRPNTDSVKTTENGQAYIELVVNDEPDLVEYIEQRDREFHDTFKYTNIAIWVRKRYEKKEDEYSNYTIYETDPTFVINEIKMIIDDINTGKEINYLANNTPEFGAAVLIRDFYSVLSEEQITFCCDVLLGSMPMVFSLAHKHEVTDGTYAILSSMPFLFDRIKPDSDEYIGLIISYVLALLTDYSDSRNSCRLFAMTMWDAQPTTAAIIFSLYVNLITEFRKWIRTKKQEEIEQFPFQYEQKIERIIKAGANINAITFSDFNVNDFMNVSLVLDSNNEAHYVLFVQLLADGIFQKVFHESRHNTKGDKLDYHLVLAFIEWLADFIYLASVTKVDKIVNLIMTNASEASSNVNNLLTKILFKHDVYKDNSKFWYIWNGFFPFIKVLCEKRREAVNRTKNLYLGELNEIIATYCFAWPWWGEQQKNWIGVQYEHLYFFDTVAKEMGYMPAVLYSFAYFLCTIGSDYIVEGTCWISTIIAENENLATCELMINTIYHLENVLIDLVEKYKDDVRKKESLRKAVLIVLNYLVERESTVGFLIREELF